MFNKRSLAIAASAAALLAVFALRQSAGSDTEDVPMRLEGAWLGNTPGLGRTTWAWAPSDSSAKRASCIVHFTGALHPDFLGFLALLGQPADAPSDFPAEANMTGKNTGLLSEVAYALKEGEIVWIFVIKGTFEIKNSHEMELHQCATIYPAAADGDGDGLPDPNTPIPAAMTIPMITYATRIPAPAPCAE